jgi:hypothetical protein
MKMINLDLIVDEWATRHLTCVLFMTIHVNRATCQIVLVVDLCYTS